MFTTEKRVYFMKDLLNQFEQKPPEIVFEWHDAESEAKGWLVINSLRGGAAGGGTRMRKGLNRNEVVSLAKTMEVKFTISGPAIGGAKSGINFDPQDPRKHGVLKRWYKAVVPLLKHYYGTGGDMNVDKNTEVVPMLEEHGLWHPQEGIVRGHFAYSERDLIHKLSQLRQGVALSITDPRYTPSIERRYDIAEMITGFGVAESIRHYYQLWGGNISDKRAIIQGWGNVGAAAAWYLASYGVKIVGIIDGFGGHIPTEGLGLAEITNLFNNRVNRRLTTENLLGFDEANEKIWDIGADIFIPAAGSRLIDRTHFDKLKAGGLEVMAAGANVPFNDPEIFYGETLEYADHQVAVIPDFIANCGMARVFAFLMDKDKKLIDHEIFQDTSDVIENALKRTQLVNPETTGITAASLRLAIEEVMKPRFETV